LIVSGTIRVLTFIVKLFQFKDQSFAINGSDSIEYVQADRVEFGSMIRVSSQEKVFVVAIVAPHFFKYIQLFELGNNFSENFKIIFHVEVNEIFELVLNQLIVSNIGLDLSVGTTLDIVQIFANIPQSESFILGFSPVLYIESFIETYAVSQLSDTYVGVVVPIVKFVAEKLVKLLVLNTNFNLSINQFEFVSRVSALISEYVDVIHKFRLLVSIKLFLSIIFIL